MPSLRPLITWPSRPAPAPLGNGERGLLIVLVVLACALRLVQVGFSFDTDEVFSVRLASQPFATMIDGALWDRSHPPLHLLLLHGWLAVFGTSELAARSLSVLASAAFLVFAHAVTRRVAGALPAAALVLLVAVSPFFTYYGQQARPYSLIATLSALNLLMFLRAMDRPSASRGWFAWAASAVLLVYAQYVGVLLLGVEALVALVCLRRAAIWPLSLLAAAVLTVSPWVWAAMGSRVTQGGNPLDLIAWMSVPGVRDLGFQLVAPFGDGALRASVLLLIVVAIIVAGVARLVRRGTFDAPRVLILLGAVLVPVLLFAAARLANTPVFAPRQLIGASFCLLVLLVLTASALPRKLGLATLAASIAYAAFTLPTVLPATRNPDWPAIAAYFDVDRDGAAVRSAEPWITDPLQFYRRRGAVYGPMPMNAGESGPSTLLVCRPQRCEDAASGAATPPTRTWRWGNGSIYELRVYERAH